MKTIIAGSRTITSKQIISNAIAACSWNITEIVSGCAVGVDKLGESLAKSRNIPVKQFPANWKQYGRAAGPIRNRQMAEYAEALIAVWDGKSKGTSNMIKEAEKKGLKIYVYKIA